MSFILDALRKSENERQRNRAPGIADMQSPQKQSKRSLWLPLVALLAGLNLALLGVLWFAAGDNSNTDPAVAAVTDNRSNTAVKQPPAATAASSNRNLSAELQAPQTAEPARFASIAPPATGTQTAPAAAAAASATGAAVAEPRMLTVTEAMLDGSLSIKPLHLDIHVYSDDPSERFVFINTSRYTEGERTSEGPAVDTITEQGVILNYQGRDYLLSRE